MEDSSKGVSLMDSILGKNPNLPEPPPFVFENMEVFPSLVEGKREIANYKATLRICRDAHFPRDKLFGHYEDIDCSTGLEEENVATPAGDAAPQGKDRKISAEMLASMNKEEMANIIADLLNKNDSTEENEQKLKERVEKAKEEIQAKLESSQRN